MNKCLYCGKIIKRPFYPTYPRKYCNKKCYGLSCRGTRLDERNAEIIKDFQKTLSYTITGKNFDVTRQRIEQIIKKYAPELVETTGKYQKRFTPYYGKPCKKCGKLLGVEVKHCGLGYCEKDRYYSLPNYHPRNIYTNCINCKKTLPNNYVAGHGLCNRCYEFYRYHIFPEVRQRHREGMKRYRNKIMSDPIRKEKERIRQREYSRKHYGWKRRLV